jgi:methyl-accepting chemotaxis protein
MEETARSVQQSTELATTAQEALQEIATLTHAIADQIRSIAKASEEELTDSEEIHKDTDLINQVSSETARSMQDAELTLVNLNKLALNMENLIIAMKTS